MLKRLRVYVRVCVYGKEKLPVFFFSLSSLPPLFGGEFYGLSQYSTLCALCSKQEHSRLNFGFASSSLPLPRRFVVSERRRGVCLSLCVCVCRQCTCVKKSIIVKRLPINLLSWKFD